MKRTVAGVVLLLILLAGGILSGHLLSQHNIRLAEQLEVAAARTMDDALPEGISLAEEARTAWEKSRNLSAAFADHAPLEQIDISFARLTLYAEAGDALAFAAVCADLAEQLRAVGDAHGAQWWNIL